MQNFKFSGQVLGLNVTSYYQPLMYLLLELMKMGSLYHGRL